jgi:hypothetical protein
VSVLDEVAAERKAQDAKWGEQNHDDGTGGPVMKRMADEQRVRTDFLADVGGLSWRDILLEEVYEAVAEDDEAKLRTELIQVAAVAVAWVEAINRREKVSAGSV